MQTNYSVQQIKFELLSYMKEFGTAGEEWRIAAVDERAGRTIVGDGAAIWITKPAVSARAAELVCRHMIERFGVLSVPAPVRPETANWVLMYRADRPSDADS